jgi:hypothetical protein
MLYSTQQQRTALSEAVTPEQLKQLVLDVKSSKTERKTISHNNGGKTL